MTFKQIQDEVIAAGFSDAGYRARIKDWINDAQGLIARQLRLRVWEQTATINLVAGTASYSLPADFLETRYIADLTNDNTLVPVDLVDFDVLPTSTGTPDQFSARGANLLVWPTPDAALALTHNYWRSPTALSGDSDVPELLPASPYHELLVSYATSRAFRRQNDLNQAAAWMQDFETGVRKAGNQLQDDTGTETPKQVPGAW